MKRWLTIIGLALVATVAVVAVVQIARKQHGDPTRCAAPAIALGARCCGARQTVLAGTCSGVPKACAPKLVVNDDGCVPLEQRVRVPGGETEVGPSDWEAHAQTAPRVIKVASFEIDSHEVTLGRWRNCVAAGPCRAVPEPEPGRPVRGVSAEEADRYCHFIGGRLPTGNEWIFAAAGPESRRYPWGQTGLVCRRASFGLLDGPCAHRAEGPEVAGSRPDGCTESGICDLAGNVAEWTREPSRAVAARGGSFRSRLAGELKSWSVEDVPASGAPHVGFRCAYDVAP